MYVPALLIVPSKISPYKFVPRNYLLNSFNTGPMGQSTVKARNETKRPDDDDPTSHSLLLTSSLDKTGGRFPGVADESKTHSLTSHNTPSENNNTTKFTSDKITSIDKHTTTTFTYTNKLPPSVEATCRKLYRKYGHPVKTYRRWKKSSSQPPIYTPDTTAGHFFWSGCDDDPPESLDFSSAASQH